MENAWWETANVENSPKTLINEVNWNGVVRGPSRFRFERSCDM